MREPYRKVPVVDLRPPTSEFVAYFPGMPECGYIARFPLFPADPEFLKTFEDMPKDPYVDANRHRLWWQGFAYPFARGQRKIETASLHRPFFQNAYGGRQAMREFKPVINPQQLFPYINLLLNDILRVDVRNPVQLDVQQYRVYGMPKPGGAGSSSPEGPHRDNRRAVSVMVLRREGITKQSAKFSLIDPRTKMPFCTNVLQAGEGNVLDDGRVLHYAGPIEASGLVSGFRDFLVINTQPEYESCHGRRFEFGFLPEEQRQDWVDPWREVKDARKASKKINSANGHWKRVQKRITFRHKEVLAAVGNLEQKIESLGGFQGLDFTEADLTNAKKSALALTANIHRRQARINQAEGDERGQRHDLQTVRECVDALTHLKDGEKPGAEDGLDFTDRDLQKLERVPVILRATSERQENRWRAMVWRSLHAPDVEVH